MPQLFGRLLLWISATVVSSPMSSPAREPCRHSNHRSCGRKMSSRSPDSRRPRFDSGHRRDSSWVRPRFVSQQFLDAQSASKTRRSDSKDFSGRASSSTQMKRSRSRSRKHSGSHRNRSDSRHRSGISHHRGHHSHSQRSDEFGTNRDLPLPPPPPAPPLPPAPQSPPSGDNSRKDRRRTDSSAGESPHNEGGGENLKAPCAEQVASSLKALGDQDPRMRSSSDDDGENAGMLYEVFLFNEHYGHFVRTKAPNDPCGKDSKGKSLVIGDFVELHGLRAQEAFNREKCVIIAQLKDQRLHVQVVGYPPNIYAGCYVSFVHHTCITKISREVLEECELKHRDLIVENLQVMQKFEREQEQRHLKYLAENPEADTCWSNIGPKTDEALVIKARKIYEKEESKEPSS